ncbi:MAG TPA: hypothetical protein VFX22_05025, partial [Candidatus Kapabacteria bacterium]|nr:hypothetical protein [Candidatus Kapabacteria bacterium]
MTTTQRMSDHSRGRVCREAGSNGPQQSHIMEYWQELLRKSVESKEEIISQFGIKPEVAEKLNDFFQTRVNPYYLSLIRHKGDPIWLQC